MIPWLIAGVAGVGAWALYSTNKSKHNADDLDAAAKRAKLAQEQSAAQRARDQAQALANARAAEASAIANAAAAQSAAASLVNQAQMFTANQAQQNTAAFQAQYQKAIADQKAAADAAARGDEAARLAAVQQQARDNPVVPFKKDPIILYVQHALNAQSFGPLAEDGNWGPLTSGAVHKYQRAMGLDDTGSVTEDLLDSLEQYSPAIARPAGPPPATHPY